MWGGKRAFLLEINLTEAFDMWLYAHK
jgi:hypothetical protein